MRRRPPVPEEVPEPVNDQREDMLRHLRGYGIGQYQAEYRPVEHHQPVFPANTLACLLGMIQPGLNTRYLLTCQLA
jgi:hypothetical protein